MAGKVNRVKFHLNAHDIQNPTIDEIKAILRGADRIIMSGGRTLLAKILKGSKDQKLLERELDTCPVYGYYKDQTIEQITAKIDWLILNDYLNIEYDYRLPLLVFTRKGWQIEMETMTNEFIDEFDKMIESGVSEFDMTFLKDRNREMIHVLLDKIQATRDKRYIPILKAWALIDYKKVKQRIQTVIQSIESSG